MGYSLPEQRGESGDSGILNSSRIYRDFSAIREEILRHKWIESEKKGYDVGFEWALVDWTLHHRAAWRRERKSKLQNIAHTSQLPQSRLAAA